MPQKGQTSITVKSSNYKLAKDYVKKHKLKSVASFVTELILEKTTKGK